MKAPPIFIVAQGRTGSTFMWESFRRIPGCTAYLEPLHPHIFKKIEKSHWNEFSVLPQAEVQGHWNRARKALFAPAGVNDAADPLMKAYIDYLNRKSPGRLVMQFNRIWGYVEWLREQYPDSPVLHQWRNVDDQFKSARRANLVSDFFHEVSGRFGYTHPWTLRMNAKSPERFHAIWALCYNVGIAHATLTTRYEDLVADPEEAFRRSTRPQEVTSSPQEEFTWR
jgi:hypothetical protein